jgi:hypothetical protein
MALGSRRPASRLRLAPGELIMVRCASGVMKMMTLPVERSGSRCTVLTSTPAAKTFLRASSEKGPVPMRVAILTSWPSWASTVATVPPAPPGSITARLTVTSPPGSGSSLMKYMRSTVMSPTTKNLGILSPGAASCCIGLLYTTPDEEV